MKKGKTEGEKKKKIRIDIIIPIIAIAVLGISAWKIWMIQSDYHTAVKEYDDLKQYAEVEEETSDTIDEESEIVRDYPNKKVNFEALRNVNEDFRAWIYVEGLDIDYPIVQGKDNEIYLSKSFEGKNVKSGSIFLDYQGTSDFSDRNTFVYGHNMKNGSMFGALKKFRNDDTLCAKNPYIYIYTEDKILKYEIFAYAVISPESELYQTVQTDEEYDSYYEIVMNKNAYKIPKDDKNIIPIAWKKRPNILSLSTCAGNGEQRFLVQGALIGEFTYLPGE